MATHEILVPKFWLHSKIDKFFVVIEPELLCYFQSVAAHIEIKKRLNQTPCNFILSNDPNMHVIDYRSIDWN